jgi:hypothetical protein
VFKCYFNILLPLVPIDGGNQLSIRVAEFNFDPGLNINDQVLFQDVAISQTHAEHTGQRIKSSSSTFTFEASVTKRYYHVTQNTENDRVDNKFSLKIEFEIADKEVMSKMVDQIVSKFPDAYKAYSPDLNE